MIQPKKMVRKRVISNRERRKYRRNPSGGGQGASRGERKGMAANPSQTSTMPPPMQKRENHSTGTVNHGNCVPKSRNVRSKFGTATKTTNVKTSAHRTQEVEKLTSAIRLRRPGDGEGVA